MSGVVDYSWARPDPKCLAAAGYHGVGRYYDGSLGASGKELTPSEAKLLAAADLETYTVFETSGGAANGAAYFTPAEGKADAQAALEAARRCGQPAGSTIYFAVDYDAQDADLLAILSYLTAARGVLMGEYITGVYGSYRVCVTAIRAAYRAWQTMAWSRGAIAIGIDLYQGSGLTVCGGAVDLNDSFAKGWKIGGLPMRAATAEDVKQMYRFYLGREPENDAAVTGRIGQDAEQMALDFLLSGECKARTEGLVQNRRA